MNKIVQFDELWSSIMAPSSAHTFIVHFFAVVMSIPSLTCRKLELHHQDLLLCVTFHCCQWRRRQLNGFLQRTLFLIVFITLLILLFRIKMLSSISSFTRVLDTQITLFDSPSYGFFFQLFLRTCNHICNLSPFHCSCRWFWVNHNRHHRRIIVFFIHC